MASKEPLSDLRSSPNYLGRMGIYSSMEITMQDPDLPIYFESLRLEGGARLTIRTWRQGCVTFGDVVFGKRCSIRFLPPRDAVSRLGDLCRYHEVVDG